MAFLAGLPPPAPRGDYGLACCDRLEPGTDCAAILLSPQTIANWMKRLDDHGPDALVRTPEPVNRFPDFVREAVRQLAATSPPMGRQRLADTLARVGLDVAASSVRRITREMPKLPPRPADPIKPSEAKSDARGVEATRPDHVW